MVDGRRGELRSAAHIAANSTMRAQNTADLAKGGLLLGVAKLVFLLATYVTSTTLAWLVDPRVFGQYNVVARLIAIPNMVVIQTLLFAVSRPMAAEFDMGHPSYGILRRRGFRLALLLGGTISAGFFVGAPVLAEQFRDHEIAWPLRVVAPISLLYALYAVNVGTLNATRRFSLQASLDMFMAVTKAALILAAAFAGGSLAAAFGGFTLASALALTLSVVFVAKTRPLTTPRARGEVPGLAAFAGVLVAFTAAVNLLQSVDLLFLKRFAADDPDAVGFYSGAQLVALVPYSLMNAASLIMFPLIATLHATRDRETTRRYVTKTLEVTMLLLTFMSSVAASAADGVITLLFPKAYGSAVDVLRLTVWGTSGYSVLVTTAWILNSSKQSRMALVLVGTTLASLSMACLMWIPQAGAAGAARSVALAGAVGCGCALFAAARVFGAVPRISYLARLAAAALLVELGARMVHPSSRAGVLLELVLLASIFVIVVVVTRVVTWRELQELRRR